MLGQLFFWHKGKNVIVIFLVYVDDKGTINLLL